MEIYRGAEVAEAFANFFINKVSDKNNKQNKTWSRCIVVHRGIMQGCQFQFLIFIFPHL